MAAAWADTWKKRKESLPKPERSVIEKKLEKYVEKIENGDKIDDIQYYRKVELDNSSVVTFTTKYGNIGVKKILTITD